MNLFSCLFPCTQQNRFWLFGGVGNSSGSTTASSRSRSPSNSNSSDTVAVTVTGDDVNYGIGRTFHGCTRMGINISSNAQLDADGESAMVGLYPPHRSSGESAGVVVRERKKRMAGFATLRKKLIRRRRSSKACDHGRVIRELVSSWAPGEVGALLDEYESLAALKDLAVQAELARPPAATYKQDLSVLYDFKYCTDADLVYRGACFPIHRALLSARCPYFRDLLAGCPGYGARICLELRTLTVDVQLFSALLRYLYTGDICPHDSNIDVVLLRRLKEEFGTPNALEADLRYLLETGDYADAALVFTSDNPLTAAPTSVSTIATGMASTSGCARPDSSSGSEYGFRPKLELPCHKAILSARSPFFRNLIQRRTRTGEDQTERALHIPTRIVLDETVIPKRYAKVLLHAVYLDTVDLSLILRQGGGGYATPSPASTSVPSMSTNSGSSIASALPGSLGEVQALAFAGRSRPSMLEEAMELYQIGRFLELDILSQGCEDLILEWLCLDTLPTILHWSSQPHGSSWVHRQALHYLREEFQLVMQSPIFYTIDKRHLACALQSDFLQASELEVLQAVLKWGEHELIKRMEDRDEQECRSALRSLTFVEPNLLNHTAHSVTRKGVKKRDLNDKELRDVLAELLPLVRTEHVLPADSEVLAQAVRRGLISTPPSHMLGEDRLPGSGASGAGLSGAVRVDAWIRGSVSSVAAGPRSGGVYVRPRLFMPYYEEVKSILEVAERVQDADVLMRVRRARHMPDTLYMVEEKPRGPRTVDVLAAVLPAPDPATLAAMRKREHKLRQAPSCQRALNLVLSSRHEIYRQIRLRVVREFNLPDAVADMLEQGTCLCPNETELETEGEMDGESKLQTSPLPAASAMATTTKTGAFSLSTRSRNSYYQQSSRHNVASVSRSGGPLEPAPESGAGLSNLSEVMPDVAIASTLPAASLSAGMAQLHLHERRHTSRATTSSSSSSSLSRHRHHHHHHQQQQQQHHLGLGPEHEHEHSSEGASEHEMSLDLGDGNPASSSTGALVGGRHALTYNNHPYAAAPGRYHHRSTHPRHLQSSPEGGGGGGAGGSSTSYTAPRFL